MPGDYLKTARVLVVDDVEKEALPIMLALSMSGIGYIYFKGENIEDLPSEPFKGIRLVFLDLQLGLGGDSNIVLPKTVNVLKKLIDPETMPLLIICWTRHEEDIQQFSKMAMDAVPGLKPGFIKNMPKPKMDVESWKKNELWSDIKKTIEQYPAVRILWDWEQVVHEAVTDTTQALADAVKESINADVSGDFQNQWMDNLLKVLRAMVKAETGKTATKVTAPRALFNVLNTLASDRLTHKFSDKEISYSDVILPQENEKISDSQKATLNQMILIEPIQPGDFSVRPGNIYLPDSELKENCLHAIAKLDFAKLAGQMLEIKKDDQECQGLKEEIGKIKTDLRRKPDDKILEERLKEKENKIKQLAFSRCRPILLEISPFCDFSQNKRPVSRFIAGLLVQQEHLGCIKETGRAFFMHRLPSLFVYGLGGMWIPIFNSRFQFGVPVELVHNKPLCRIRSQALVDIQAWAASQASRPGKLSIE
jgi:hypothetical protein